MTMVPVRRGKGDDEAIDEREEAGRIYVYVYYNERAGSWDET